MSIIISCSGKFHAFALAEQLNRHGMLSGFYTSYAYQKNKLFRKLAGRVDKEAIPPHLIHTAIPIAVGIKGFKHEWLWNEWFDKLTALRIRNRNDYQVFIGWSGMSLRSLRQAKNDGKSTILERGSSHILYQNQILKEEYRKFKIDFEIHPKVIEKELKEYEEADFISIPSLFVKNTFIEYGINENKLIHNPYGTSSHFQSGINSIHKENDKFRILYLGTSTIQKGVVYLFEAIKKLSIPEDNYEFWIIGQVSEEIKPILERYQSANWKVFGHINHYELPHLLTHFDIGVQPSLQDGLSMVIIQMLACGLPVIATTNTGALDIIYDGTNGYIVPIRSSDEIQNKIEYLYNHPDLLSHMKIAAKESKGLSWDNYGNRYAEFLMDIIR